MRSDRASGTVEFSCAKLTIDVVAEQASNSGVRWWRSVKWIGFHHLIREFTGKVDQREIQTNFSFERLEVRRVLQYHVGTEVESSGYGLIGHSIFLQV